MRRVTTVLRDYGALARLLWVASPGWTVLSALIRVLEAALVVLVLPVIGQLVQAVGQRSPDAWSWFAALVVVQLLAHVVSPLAEAINAEASRAYTTHLVVWLAETGQRPAGLAWIEGEPGSQLRELNSQLGQWELVMSLNWVWDLVSARLSLIGVLVIVISWNWWYAIILLVLMGVSSVTFDRLVATMTPSGDGADAAEDRRIAYLREQLVSPGSAKELRLFGWLDWLHPRYTRSWRTLERLRWRKSRGGLAPMVLVELLSWIGFGGALVLVARDTFAGLLTVAAALTFAQALVGLHQYAIVGDMQTYTTRLATRIGRVAGLRRRGGLDPFAVLPEPSRATPAAGGQIDLVGLRYSYPGREQPVLRGVDLQVPAGQRLALVGLNGAGKSTLISLLCGLRTPDAGQILVGGQPVTEPDGRVAAIFQDFERYPLSLADNVVLGAPALAGSPAGDAVALRALTRAAADPVVDRVAEDGSIDQALVRPLSAQFTGGTDLSGGQWQRIALARALAAVEAGATVLVLDEPTAALDVRAEAELFDRFAEVTAGVTTILVTHRLSSVRHADRIVVLDGDSGQIVEDGNHAELLAAGGGYARL